MIRGEVTSARILGEAFWGIVRVQPATGAELTAIGKWPGVQAGDHVEVTGCWSEHPKYGRQLKARSVEVVVPADDSGAVSWLRARCPHLGPARARAVVERFGVPGVWAVIEHEPARLLDVPGITSARLEQITHAYRKHRAERDRQVRLRRWGLTDGQIAAVLDVWGEDAERELERNPYQLAEHVHGFGFKRADEVARRMGLPTDSAPRIRAGLLWLLEEAAAEGHVYVSAGKLVAMAARALDVPEAAVRTELAELEQGGRVALRGGRAVYPRALAEAEAKVADRVRAALGRVA